LKAAVKGFESINVVQLNMMDGHSVTSAYEHENLLADVVPEDVRVSTLKSRLETEIYQLEKEIKRLQVKPAWVNSNNALVFKIMLTIAVRWADNWFVVRD
jgi:hypothetical protein